MTLVSGVMSANASYQQGKAAKYNADYNAKLAENQAEQGQMESRENARRQLKNNQEQLSAARARFANQGAVSNAGAPLAMMGDIAGELELGVMDAYRSADIQRTQMLGQARLEKYRGKQAYSSGKLLAGTQLLSTGASLFGNYSAGKRTGTIR